MAAGRRYLPQAALVCALAFALLNGGERARVPVLPLNLCGGQHG